jgi:hypothetical protein
MAAGAQELGQLLCGVIFVGRYGARTDSTCQGSRPAYTSDGMPKNHEIDEMLKMEAEALGLKEPYQSSRVFDFTLQRQVNDELGMK